VVVEQNKAILTKPVVRVFYCTATARTVPPVLLDLSIEDAIASMEERDRWPAAALEALWAGDLVR